MFSFPPIHPIKKYFIFMFLLSCLLLEVLSFFVHQQSETGLQSGAVTSQISAAANAAENAAINLVGAEQDYLNSSSRADLQTYRLAETDLTARLAALRTVTSEDATEMHALGELSGALENVKDVAERHIKSDSDMKLPSATLKNFHQETRASTTRLQKMYEDLSQSEKQLAETRRKQAESPLWAINLDVLVGFGALLVLNLAMFSFLTRANRKSEEKLNKSKELLAFILNGLNDGIFDYDVASGAITYSPSAEEMLGYTTKELGTLQSNLYRYVHPDDLQPAVDVLDQYLREQTPHYINTFRVKHKDGHWLWLLSRGIGIRDEKGKIHRLIGTHTDITMQKKREEELSYFIHENQRQHEELAEAKEHAEAASHAKSDFLATMSHEIRTPMNVVVGLAHLMLGTELDVKQRHMMEALHANTGILLQLVDSLLDISRIEAGQIEIENRSFALDTTFGNLRALFEDSAASKGLSLMLMNEVGAQAFFGDPSRIQQILVNLIGNALKFTSRGNIVITATADPVDEKTETQLVHIAVADTGVGIQPDKLNVIFEKFVQEDQSISRRFGGSGLGLAICKSLADLMRGDITVKSQPGRGSVFTLHLPLKLDKAPQQTGTTKITLPTHRPLMSGEILVVEDYADNVMVVTMMLKQLGYSVDIANNGTEALFKIANRAQPYHAVLMDVQMQDMDGYETTRRIRTHEQKKGFRHLIIGVTAHALAGDREKCLQAGMDGYMTKPIQLELLDQMLRQPNHNAA